MEARESLRARTARLWTGFRAAIGRARAVHYASQLDELEEATSREIDALLEGKTDDELEEILKTLRERRSNLVTQPDFTPEVVGVSKQILAFGAAGIAVLVAFAPRLQELSELWLQLLATAGLLYLNLMFSSLLVLGWFFMQARSRYPFLFLRKLGNTIPFFYYQTLGRDTKWRAVHTKRGLVEANTRYARDLKGFAEHVLSADLRTQVRTELQQYYILLVYQGYLDQYELQLVNLFLYTTLGGMVSVMAITVFFL